MGGLRSTNKERDRIIQYHKNGWSAKSIAREMGRSYGFIQSVIKNAKIQGPVEQTTDGLDTLVMAANISNDKKLKILQALWS